MSLKRPAGIMLRPPGGAVEVFYPVNLDLSQALSQTLASVPRPIKRIAVALSGGADSAMLALHAAALAREHDMAVVFFHVHHGLQTQADQWVEHVHALGRLLCVPVSVVYAQVARNEGKGLEAAARKARYAAFAQLVNAQHIDVVLLAHHQHDQAETVLLRLLRGSGLEGMAAMAAVTHRDGVDYARPWLAQDRTVILQCARDFSVATGWQPVLDPSNVDPHYARAAVREQLAPVLDERWPSWRRVLARHAQHMADAALILAEVAEADFANLAPSADGHSFALQPWRDLSAPRQTQVLRYWLSRQGAQMPTEARMRALLRQLRDVHCLGYDRQVRVEQAGHVIRCHRGRVWVEPR